MIEIRPITAADTVTVRWPVLRPGFPRETAIFDGDHAADTAHLGAFENGRLLGVASIYRAPMPGRGDPAAWQLRGMATLPEARGRGFGRRLLTACEDSARAAAGTLLWCNARIPAAPFYQRHGWRIEGAEFDIPTVGPHLRMWRELRAPS